MYVVLDVGCLECDERTTIAGVFASLAEAKKALKNIAHYNTPDRCGDRAERFQILEVPAAGIYNPALDNVPPET